MPTLKNGFYHPISILILAVITLTVALAIFANSGFFSNKNKPTPSPTPQVSPKPAPEKSPTKSSPKTSPAGQTANPDLFGADWKTYTNKKYKYSFRYPTNIEVVSLVEGDEDLENTASVGVQGSAFDLGNIFIINTYEAPTTTLAIVENDYKKDVNNTNFTYITNDGVKGIEFIYYNSKKRLEFVNNGILYDFSLDLPVKNNFDQILSTFQFLN